MQIPITEYRHVIPRYYHNDIWEKKLKTRAEEFLIFKSFLISENNEDFC